MTERAYEFNWDIIGDLQEGRPNLGDQVSLILYRLMHYTFHEVTTKTFGEAESNKLFREAGTVAGKFFFEHFLQEYKNLPKEGFLEEFRAVLDKHGVRFLRVDSVDTEKEMLSLSIATRIDGIGPNLIEMDDYYYDAGFAEGVLSKYTGKNFGTTTVNINAVQEILPKMGDQIGLIPYRMLQYTVRDVIEQRVGTEKCNELYYAAGDIAGKFLFDNFMVEFKGLPLNDFFRELQRLLKELGVGILRVEKADVEHGDFTLTVSEDLDCSGLPDLGIEVCNYDEGFIAGIFYRFTGAVFKAKEVDCWCSGDRTCRFVVKRA